MGFQIFAHRGLNRQAPENTLAAFQAAADTGVHWIETDVDVLADGTIIICHDSTLDRTTNTHGGYYQHTKDILPSIDAGSWFSPDFAGEPLPTLAQLVELMNATGLHANIELKSPEAGAAECTALIDGVLAELQHLNANNQVLISSFNHVLLVQLHTKAPELPIACLFERHTLGPDWRAIAEMVGAVAIHPEDTGLQASEVAAMREHGYQVNVWTVNDRGRMNQLKNWGATGVFSDIANEVLDLEQPHD